MSVWEWMETSRDRVRANGLKGVFLSARDFKAGVRRRVVRGVLSHRPEPHATNVFEQDWDYLIILDCARPEFFEVVADEYDFISDIGRITSPGSSSPEWIRNTFVPEYRSEIERTGYVTANPHSPKISHPEWLQELDEVWKYGYDTDKRTILPRTVTDRAITHARSETAPKRLIVHYMQPHTPFLRYDGRDFKGVTRPGEEAQYPHIAKALRMGLVSPEEMRTAHLDNLRAVLDDVELLLENLPAGKAVLTADHGQGLGRLRDRFVTGHPTGIAVKPLRTVPWIETSTTDTATYTPTTEAKDDTTETSVEETLAALGYRSEVPE